MNSPRKPKKPAAVTFVPVGFATAGGFFLVPFNLNTDEATRLLGSSKWFKRARFWKWLVPLEKSAPGRASLYPYSKLVELQARFERREFPPLLPCEERERERKAAAAAARGPSPSGSIERRSA